MTRSRLKRRQICVLSVLSLISIFAARGASTAEQPVIGVNAAMSKLSVADQNARLDALQAAGVKFIRAGITPDARGLDLARRAQAHGIKILWLVDIKYKSDAPNVPYPTRFGPGVWGGHPLSSADPNEFRKYFEPLLAKVESEGITLAGFELGNEINSGCFNSEFVLSAPPKGHATLFGLDDLNNNPKAAPIAKGYLQYIKLLAVLKDVRDHSKLNRNTPIITAGLVSSERPEGPAPQNKLNAVSANATIEFWRANGLDQIVDAYGVHTYPEADHPGDREAAIGRKDRLDKYVLAQSHPEGSAKGKPVWITEWGFENKDTSCPPHESNQVALVKELKNDFGSYVRKKKLGGLFYYAWADDKYGIYRCDTLTETGRAALQPF